MAIVREFSVHENFVVFFSVGEGAGFFFFSSVMIKIVPSSNLVCLPEHCWG